MDIPGNVTIGRISQSIRFDDYGHALRIKLIDYKVGADGPFTLEVPPENDNPGWIGEQLLRAAQAIGQIRGQS